jgi:hypothetical protein
MLVIIRFENCHPFYFSTASEINEQFCQLSYLGVKHGLLLWGNNTNDKYSKKKFLENIWY